MFLKCNTCGAIGNWREFIECGLCHKKRVNSLLKREDELTEQLRKNLSEEDMEKVSKLIAVTLEIEDECNR